MNLSNPKLKLALYTSVCLSFLFLPGLSKLNAQQLNVNAGGIYAGQSEERRVLVYGNFTNDQLNGGPNRDCLNGNSHQDQLFGNGHDDQLSGGIGNDFLDGGQGRDDLFGGSGNDVLHGGPDDDVLYGDGPNYIAKGPEATPDFTYIYDGDPNSTYYGNMAIEVNGVRRGPIPMLFVYQEEGTDWHISYPGGTNAKFDGDDQLYGGPGNDYLDGNGGEDTADYSAAASWVEANLSNHLAPVDGDGGVDSLYNIENLKGSDYDDRLTGDAQANVLTGGPGNDQLGGGAGDDMLLGGPGDDQLDDGPGQDTLTGGLGNDLFVFGNSSGYNNLITDFEPNDEFDLRGFGLNASGIEEKIINGSKQVTVLGEVTVLLENYTGTVNYLYAPRLNAGSGSPVSRTVINDLSTMKTIKLAVDTAYCIDNQAGQLVNGNNIQLWTFQKGNTNQSWIFDQFQIKQWEDHNKCINLDRGIQSNGANIELYQCRDEDYQKWVYDGISKQLRYLKNPEKCLDLSAGKTSNGGNIQLWDCQQGNTNQQWDITLGDALPIDTKVTTRKTGSISPIAAESKCVSLQGYSVSNNTNIQLEACNGAYGTYGDRDQAWYFDGMQIKLNKTQNDSPSKCLDLDGSNTTNGRNIQLFDCNGTDAQKWLYDGLTNQFRSKIDPNKCLDISNGERDGFSSGTNIQIWDCMRGNPNQQFTIKNI